MKLLAEIEGRVSISNFIDKPIEQEKLDNVLEAGRRAPSAKNRQPWRFIVLQSEANKKKIEQAAYGQSHVGEAGAIIVACTTNIDYRMPNGQLSYPIDIAFAISFMMLQAEKEALGSCVITTFDEAEVKELLSVPYSMRIVMLLLLGYPGVKRLPKPRQPMERIVSYEHW